jgi:hypothetical protein
MIEIGAPEPASLADVQGKRLVLYREQGLGDVIQFARFARTFAEAGARVTILAFPALRRLLKSLGDDIEIVSDGSPVEGDFALPLMSAPALLGTTLETALSHVPYLNAPAALREVWRERVRGAAPRGLRVGLTWSGNVRHVNDWARSIPFETLSPLFDVPDVTYFSLQNEVRPAEEVSFTNSGVVDFRAHLTDFAETAALVSELDVVISVDTSVAHLAGALGKPLWVLLAKRVDWRWMATGDTSPWYPNACLFRQTAPGDWESAIDSVRAALTKLAADIPM